MKVSLPMLKQEPHFLTGKPLTRTCGGCTVCCEVLALASLRKPYACKCQHQTKNGCAIYADRPEDCSFYTCLWLVGIGDAEERPDKSGMLWNIRAEDDKIYVDVHETRPGVFRQTSSNRFNRIVERLQRVIQPAILKHLAGIMLHVHGYVVGALYESGPNYPACVTGGRLFAPIEPGSLIYVYLGPSNDKGELFVDGKVLNETEQKKHYQKTLALILEDVPR